MQIYSALQIGSFHTNHCEDFLVTSALGHEKRLIAVMDGCTMGEDSVFASVLVGKILKNISKKYYYQAFREEKTDDLKVYLKEIVCELIVEMKQTKNQLGLETNELLTTLIIGITDEKNFRAEFLVIGDGLICCDGKFIDFEQDDKPDYLAYHLSEHFDSWYDAQNQFLSIPTFSDLSICTDGIYTFKNFGNPSEQKDEDFFKAFLLKDKEGMQHEKFLDNKLAHIRDHWNHIPGDDLAIIRVIR